MSVPTDVECVTGECGCECQCAQDVAVDVWLDRVGDWFLEADDWEGEF